MQLIKSLALAGLALTTGAKGCSNEEFPQRQGGYCKETDKGCYYCSLDLRHIVICNGEKYEFVADCKAPTCGWTASAPACGIAIPPHDRRAEEVKGNEGKEA